MTMNYTRLTNTRYDGSVHHIDREMDDRESARLFGISVVIGVAAASLLDIITIVLGVA